MNRKTVGLWLLILFLALLGVGTINNQLRINRANAVLAEQAQAGQRSLDRQCRLLPIGLKLYADALKRDVMSTEDYALVVSTANTACRP